MHPIEEMWIKFRGDNPGLFLIVDTYLSCPNAPAPPEVAVSTGLLGAALMYTPPGRVICGKEAGVRQLNRAAYFGNSWAAYRESKRIFALTKELATELQKLRQPLEWPAQSLRLPNRGIALDFSALLGADHPDAYILVSYDVPYTSMLKTNEATIGVNRLNLNIMRLSPDADSTLLCAIPVNDVGKTLWEGYATINMAAVHDLREQIEDLHTKMVGCNEGDDLTALESTIAVWTDEIHQHIANVKAGPEGLLTRIPIIPLVINTLYYLIGDPEVVKEVHPGCKPVKRHFKLSPKLRIRQQTFMQPTVQLIGEQFTAMVRHYEQERDRLKSEAREHQGGTKCPHLRRPHLHAYWRGPERDSLCIKAIPWLGIAGAIVPDSLKEAYTPLISPTD